MPTTRIAPPQTGAAILAEIPELSRDVITIASGQVLTANTVLGKNAGGKHVLHDPAASGSEKDACAVLYAAVDASAGDTKAVASVRLTALKFDELVWKTSITNGQINTARAKLAEANLIVRD